MIALSLAAPSDITKSGWGCALGAENSQMREPLEPDPGNAGVGKPSGRTIAARPKAASPGAREAAFSMGTSSKSPAEDAIAVTLNGDPYRLEGDPRLSVLIATLKMKPTRIAVELNGEVVPKARYHDTVVKAGDVIEIINFVGGG
jgi:sulfur carrier protein